MYKPVWPPADTLITNAGYPQQRVLRVIAVNFNVD